MDSRIKIKELLKIQNLQIKKELGEQYISFLIKDKEIGFIAPECEDMDFYSVSQLTEENKILHFEAHFSEYYCKSESFYIYKHAINVIEEYLENLTKEWVGKDVREFARLPLNLKR